MTVDYSIRMRLIESNWKDRAKCQALSTKKAMALFFVGKGGKTTAANLYCLDCPVRRSCLNYAILYGEVGIWAGTSDLERSMAPAAFKTALREEAIKFGVLEDRDIEALIRFGRNKSEIEYLDLSEFDTNFEYEPLVEGHVQQSSESGLVSDLVGSVLNGVDKWLRSANLSTLY